MPPLELIDAPRNRFARTTRIACIERGFAHRHPPAWPHTPRVDAVHSVGKRGGADA